MDITEAMKLTLELATQNALSVRECDSDELMTERLRQQDALTQVDDFISSELFRQLVQAGAKLAAQVLKGCR